MSEINDLEAYEFVPPPIESAQAASGRRNMRKAAPRMGQRGNEEAMRRHWLDGSRRQQPSLPKFKCLSD